MNRPLPLPLLLPLVLAAGAGALGGCSATVYPGPAAPADPVPVYVTDYGVHSTIVLPTADGRRFVEYAFGDWRFAVLNIDGPLDGLAALFFSKKAGLGRRYAAAQVDRATGLPAPSRTFGKSMTRLLAERAAVDALRSELDGRYERGAGPPVRNPLNGIEYVVDAERYSLNNNCNHLTARFLRRLGCRVRGPTVLSGFRVVERGGAEAKVDTRGKPPATQGAPPGGPL